jgi:Domain of unknown function (DUF1840)
MLYRFKSQATADLVMLNDTGEQMLAAMGKPVTPKGIVTVAQIPAALAALAQAVAESEAVTAQEEAGEAADTGEAPKADGVRLRQRATPLVTMLKESHAADKDVVWGV